MSPTTRSVSRNQQKL